MRPRHVDELCDVTAVILAGGLGTRLRPILDGRPKVLAAVHGRPFLAYVLNWLLDAGVNRAVLCTGYLGEQVQAAFGDGYKGLELFYSREEIPLGTGGALRKAQPLLDSDPLLVLNGDSFCEADLRSFWDWHRNRNSSGTLLLARVPDTGRYGSVRTDLSGAVRQFCEKGGTGDGWINAGVYLLSQRLITEIPPDNPVSLERDVFPHWIGQGLYGCPIGRSFLDIGTPSDYNRAELFFAPGHTPFKRRFVILDRDGTINEECDYLSEPDQVKLIPGAAAALRELTELGLGLVVITNQSAVGRGFFDQDRLRLIHRRLVDLLNAAGVQLSGIYFCPHRPEDDCQCRKPRAGLVEKAAAELGFNPGRSFVIGDKACDIELGKNVGATAFLVRTGYGSCSAQEMKIRSDYIVENLQEAAQVIRGILRKEERGIDR